MIVITTSTPPTITQQPKSMTWNEGQDITLNCNATGAIGGQLFYFWYAEGQSDYISVTYDGTLTMNHEEWESYYKNGKSFKVYCEVMEEGGVSVKSNKATITLEQTPLKATGITATKDVRTVNIYTITATFEGGTEPYKFEWQFITGNQSTSAGWQKIEEAEKYGIVTIKENTSDGNTATLKILIKSDIHIECICEDADETRESTHAITIKYKSRASGSRTQ